MWFKPLPGWKGRPMLLGQELFSRARAFEIEMRSKESIVG